MSFYENKKNQVIALGTTAFIFLGTLGGSSYLYMDNKALKAENLEKIQQLNSVSELKKGLEEELGISKEEIKGLNASNANLNGLLNAANSDIEAKKAKIQSLIAQNASMKRLKKEVYELKLMRENYVKELNAKDARIQSLLSENAGLKAENTRLQTSLNELTGKYELMSKKVEIASALKVENVVVEAMKKTKNGRYVSVNRSSKAARISLNFDLVENKIAEAGPKNIYVRILDAKGNPLPAPSSEVGTFPNLDNNVNLPYSIMETIEYNKARKKVNINYDVKSLGFEKGNYIVEFYCDGYFCGSSKLKLK